jgi:hypothetical protein
MQIPSIAGNVLAGLCLWLSLVILSSCKKPTEPDNTHGFNITVEDVSCIEAWVRVKSEGLKLPAEIIITKNQIPALSFTMTTADTVVMLDSLLPKQNYTFHAFRSDYLKTGATAQCTTMDTTSHNLTWQTWTFGEGSYSAFKDVAIINENDIWAVGEIRKTNELEIYNAAHWDGINWNVIRVWFPTVCNSSSRTAFPVQAVHVVSENEVWFSSAGGKIAVFKNRVQVKEFCLPADVEIGTTAIWGNRTDNIYIVGWSGGIAYYNGTQWTKIESGTTLRINDICGSQNTATGHDEVICVAADIDQNNGKKVFVINESKVQTVLDTGLPWYSLTIFSINARKYYIGGDGLFETTTLNSSWKKTPYSPQYPTEKIRGLGYNNIFMVGGYGMIRHFNGLTWQNYLDQIYFSNGVFGDVDVKDNCVACAGYKGNRAVITIGKK